jgi:hypothetical protein
MSMSMSMWLVSKIASGGGGGGLRGGRADGVPAAGEAERGGEVRATVGRSGVPRGGANADKAGELDNAARAGAGGDPSGAEFAASLLGRPMPSLERKSMPG